MPILNMNYGANKGGANIGEPTNLSVTATSDSATITWTDNDLNTIPPSAFFKSVLVRKIGSAPTSPSDGTTVVTETVKDTYKTTGYVDQGLTKGTTYYYKVFSYSDLGGISYCDAVSVTPQGGWQPGANTLAYYDFENDTGTTMVNQASTGNTYDGTYYTTPTYGTTADGKKYFNCGGNNYATTPIIPFSFSNTTIVMWMYFNGVTDGFIFGTGWYSSPTLAVSMQGSSSQLLLGIQGSGNASEHAYSPYPSGWHLVTCVIDGTTPKWYIDKTLVYTGSITTSGNNPYNVGIGTLYEQKHQVNRSFKGYYGSVIIENKTRAGTEIPDYYDQTKGDYGIS